MDSSLPWPSVISKAGWNFMAPNQNGIWQNWRDGGAGKGLRMLLLQKLFLQRKKQRTPLLTHLLLSGKVTPLNIIFPAPKKQIILTFGWRHWFSQSCCLCWTSDVSSLEIIWWTTSYHRWVMASKDQGQMVSQAKGNTESCYSRCWVRLKRASLWD